MKTKTVAISVVGVLVAASILLSGCGAATRPSAAAAATPAEVVENFYGWYLEYSEKANPLADKVYRSSEYLSEGFVEEVDALIASFDRGGYDPFLCAQDVPTSVTVGEAEVAGGEAIVPVETAFVGHGFSVVLQDVEGRWLITAVICR